jgi:large subunit ribosomal protein L21
MYAIIRTGGKQYKVQPGEVVRVEKIEGELGSEFDLTDILVIGGDKTFVGAPTLDNAKVTAVVTNQAKAPKVLVFKKKRRQGYRRMQGHRQPYTEIFIKAITSPEGQTFKAEGEPKVFDPAKKEERLQKLAAERKAKKASGAEKKADKATKTVKKKAAKKVAKAGAKKKTAKKKTAKKAAKKATKKTKKKSK